MLMFLLQHLSDKCNSQTFAHTYEDNFILAATEHLKCPFNILSGDTMLIAHEGKIISPERFDVTFCN